MKPHENQKFWSKYPSNEFDLLWYVHHPGISITVDFYYQPKISLRGNYGKYSVSKIAGISRNWNSVKKHHADAERLVKAYEEDLQKIEDEKREIEKKIKAEQIPIPPKPFYWHDVTGGLLIGEERCFRLWHESLGWLRSME